MNGAIFSLALKSVANRRLSAFLTILAVALSTALFLGVEKTRTGAKASFENTISDADLIVGARSGAINLVLYSLFRLGDPTANMSWESYELIDGAPGVAWTIPISLGDSHRGYRVLGTTPAYFEHYRFGRSQALRLVEGRVLEEDADVVLGSETARTLGYRLGDRIVLSHGVGAVSFANHDEHPFTVTGILAPTGTPVDRTLHVTLGGIEAMHEGWETGAAPRMAAPDDHGQGERHEEGHGDEHAHEDQEAPDHDHGHAQGDPDQITAMIVGMESPVRILSLQRQINTYQGEALSAVIPGVALTQLWSVIGAAERALLAISLFVVAVGLVSVVTSLTASVNERRREMAILRAVGARPAHVFGLLVSESAALAFCGAALGIILVDGGMVGLGALVQARYGLSLAASGPGVMDALALIAISAAGALAGGIPAWRALRNSLADGLTIRL